MNTHDSKTKNSESATLAAALPHALDSYYHEIWTCGHCGREFADCTSVAAHEQQCGGLSRW
jgi:hypothetical protein